MGTKIFLISIISLFLLHNNALSQNKKAKRPNIILIFADYISELTPETRTFKDGKLRCKVKGSGTIHITTNL